MTELIDYCMHMFATQKISLNFCIQKGDHKSSIAIHKEEGLVSKQRIK